MKNENESKNLVRSFWQKTLLDAKIITLAYKFRKKFNIPRDGFDSYEEFQKWRSKIIKAEGNDKKRINNFNNFEKEVKKVVLYRGILSERAFRRMLVEFYYYNEISKETLDDVKYSEYDIVIIEKNRQMFNINKKNKDGIYIKIGPYTPIYDIKKYIQDNSKVIRSAQDIFAAIKKIPKPNKLKSYKNFNRDSTIVSWNRLGTEQLKVATPDLIPTAYKEDRIAHALNKYRHFNINSGIVKSVIQRRRKMIKALKEKDS